MYQQSLHVQGLKQGEIKQAILDVASNAQFEGLFAAVAYSTIAGSVALVEGLRCYAKLVKGEERMAHLS